MAETKSGAATLAKYFGKRPGQTLVDFKDEINELSDESREQLVQGIKDGTLNY